MNNHNCCSCYQQLYLRDHVELKPCECIICPKCLLQSHAVRGTELLSCRGCGTTVTAHEYVNAVENEGHNGACGEIVTYSTTTSDLGGEEVYATSLNSNNNNNNDNAAKYGGDDTEVQLPEKQQTTHKLTKEPIKRKRGPRPLCKVEGCTNFVQTKQVCHTHGGKLYRKIKICRVEGCTNQVRNNGVCITHGARVEYARCSVEGCNKYSTKGGKNGFCTKHIPVEPEKQCSHEGCSFRAVRDGRCTDHCTTLRIPVEPPKYCTYEGCSVRAVRDGRCTDHCTTLVPTNKRKRAKKNKPQAEHATHLGFTSPFGEFAHISVQAPKGPLGLKVNFITHAGVLSYGAVITAIHDHCTFKDKVKLGDRIVMIDGKHSVSTMEDLTINIDKPFRTIGIVRNVMGGSLGGMGMFF